ncbi:MAG: hypothetical protein JST86_18475 [Bacteroidetes bacterium]|nr:hypothetical protein [Bacteroidota bacterium]
MITPKELLDKSEKLFKKVATAALKQENIFPLLIPANKQLAGTNYSELKTAIVPLYQQSKQVKGNGYSIEWKEKTIEGTKQKIPSKIYFETLDDYLSYTRKQIEYSTLLESFQALITVFPQLREWAIDNISFVQLQAENIPGLIRVCTYFKENKPPHNLYLRELPISVHSKFIEDNYAALRKLLDKLLPPEWIDNSETVFTNRYYIKRPNVFAQIRILDESLKPAVGFNEVALSIDDSALLTWQPKTVFLIENKACFLSFPKVKNAIAIFGEGFKSRVTKHITWLSTAELYCWFDMDAAGFEMLNIIRQYYPTAKSLLMDKNVYETFSQFSEHSVYRKIKLNNLLESEVNMYEYLQSNNIRLEQERITQEYIQSELLKMQLL